MFGSISLHMHFMFRVLTPKSPLVKITWHICCLPPPHPLNQNPFGQLLLCLPWYKLKIWCKGRVRKTHVSWWHCHLESFCASGKFLRVSMKSTIKRHAQMHRFPDGLESFRIVWKVSRWTGKFPDGLENFWLV